MRVTVVCCASQCAPILNEAIATELKSRSAVLDGEIVCVSTRMASRSSATCSFGAGEPRFIAFDLLWCEGEDLRYLPLSA